MTRVFLAIASAEYEDQRSLDYLDGVINDGVNIDELLKDPDFGQYDQYSSKLLISPSLREVRDSLEEILFESDKIDCFTFYFAGHGVSQSGTYYLCLKDSYVNKLSATALPINHIFNLINDKKPLQSNIIIDACQAGGIVNDLNSLIKPSIFGNAFSPSVSIFCACMSDQGAEELPSPLSCGVATNQLIKYISGEIEIDSKLPTLDLVQIGRNTSSSIFDEGFEQVPVVWGVNLTGISNFTKNPNFDSTGGLNFNTSTSILTDHQRETLWSYYLEIKKTGVTKSLLFSLVEIVRNLIEKNEEAKSIAAFLIATSENLSSNADLLEDQFIEPEILAVCCSAFLPLLRNEDVIPLYHELINRLSSKLCEVFNSLSDDLNVNKNVLISDRSLISDLFYLPVRLSKILGWLGLSYKIQKTITCSKNLSDEKYCNILDSLMNIYSGSLVCVSDIQGPFIHMYTNLFQLDSKFARPLVNYFKDIVKTKAYIASNSLSPSEVLSYLLLRSKNDFQSERNLIARPSELISVIFYGLSLAGFDEEVNSMFQSLDHVPLNMFITNDIDFYCNETIESGVNISMEVGSETGFGIFKLDDFRRLFNDCIAQRFQEKDFKAESQIASALFSFICSNRVSWNSLKVNLLPYSD